MVSAVPVPIRARCTKFLKLNLYAAEEATDNDSMFIRDVGSTVAVVTLRLT